MGDGATVTLDANAEPGCLDGVHALFRKLWQTVDVAEPDRLAFETAVAEVAGNIVEHASTAATRLRLSLAAFTDRLEARFDDDGPPADVDLGAARMPDPLAESGRGLALAIAASDRVSYHRDADGNHWLVLRRRAADGAGSA